MRIEKGRVGQFFLFIGVLLLAIFFTTGENETPPAFFFLGGAAALVMGVVLIRKDWKPTAPSGRFRLLRSFSRKKNEEKKKS